MDNLAHSLVGALIGQAGLKRRTGLAMPALIIGANIPDIDAGCVVFGMESFAMRRGLTHGPIAMLLLPLVLAALLWGFDRWQQRRGKRPAGRLPVHFGWLYALSFIACLTHPALDWLNNYGVRFLEPFSHRWFYGDALFIIDVWLWLGLGFATWLSLRQERRHGNWRLPARAALAIALVYIGGNMVLTRAAADKGYLYARMAGFEPGEATIIASPVPLAFWDRELLFGANGKWFRHERLGPDEGLNVALTDAGCRWPEISELAQADSDLAAFLFWSRAPFVERTREGWLLRDARFASRDGGQFSVVLPASTCDPG